MARRLAITISGAVSLGTYEAGVLYEILQAIAANNAEVSSEDDKIYIDVITGASAGAMCAAVLAQKLLYDGASLDGTHSNALHDPWVVDVSLDGLLALNADEDPAKSIFSSNLIEAISQKYLTARYTGSAPPAARAPHPALETGKPLFLGLALTNLDGVDYAQPLRTGGNFSYTRFADQFQRMLAPDGGDDSLATWESIRNAAVASGAFPFAFRVKSLQRQLSEYVDPIPENLPHLNMRFAYTDGGTLQNEPLGMAKDLVDLVDRHLNSDTRFYLFIAPHLRQSAIDQGKSLLDTLVTDGNANLAVTAGGIAHAIYNGAAFQDWVMAERLNADIAVFNRRAEQLKTALIDRTVDAATIGPAADSYLTVLRTGDLRLTGAVIAGELDRIAKQFSSECQAIEAGGLGPNAVPAFLGSLLVMELAAGLGPFDEMNILGITAESDELAGSALSSFAGFFDQNIRQHDYDVGRNKAKAFIAAQNAGGPSLGPFRYDPGAPISVDSSYDNFEISKLSIDERQSLRDRLADRADSLLSQIGISRIIRWAIATFYLNRKIGDLLQLNSSDS